MEEVETSHLNSLGFTSLPKKKEKNQRIENEHEKELEVSWVEKWVESGKIWSKEKNHQNTLHKNF